MNVRRINGKKFEVKQRNWKKKTILLGNKIKWKISSRNNIAKNKL